ncbi:hypothetical protein F2P81_001887 [Scophthalmus maximus]|uniref:Uncharacterized protein n=1 Tax=Scophthalmus maximus TaxID=52904 RepID=A0A6A4TLT0_SCOMX|nr:hypothetical protein F2P81_001887 [Scophthalmus maximus]
MSPHSSFVGCGENRQPIMRPKEFFASSPQPYLQSSERADKRKKTIHSNSESSSVSMSRSPLERIQPYILSALIRHTGFFMHSALIKRRSSLTPNQ